MKVWGWATSENAERWSGSVRTKKEAIEEACGFVNPGEEFWVQSGESLKNGYQYLPDFRFIMENAAERAYDEVGEASEDWPDVGIEGEEAFEKMMKRWATRYLPVRFWVATGTPERHVAPKCTK